MSSPNSEYQILVANIKAFTENNTHLLTKFGLKITVKSTLSGYDQVLQIFSNNFNLPIKVTHSILGYSPVTHLREVLGATFTQMQKTVKRTLYLDFKCQLVKLGGFTLKEDGSFSLVKDVLFEIT